MQQLKRQTGGTFLGFVLGVVVGLGVALAVAVYVTKVPVQFMSQPTARSPEQDATEQQKNKDWNPNAPLAGKNPVKPATTDEQPVAGAPAASASVPVAVAGKPELKPAVTADPLGDLARARAGDTKTAATGAFTYFIQIGAYRTPEDAESQRAKLSLAGIETKVSERDQAGQKVYRVRQGPFDTRDAADQAKAALAARGLDTALVRVQR